MAERLTEKIFDETGKQQDIYEWSTASSLECNRKLGKLEDILENYGIESAEELDDLIANYRTSPILTEEMIKEIAVNEQRKVIQSMIKEITEKECNQLYTELNTWKRACELASETLKQVMGKPLWIGGNIPTPEVKDSDYFYQQAKKEGEHGN